MKQTLVQKIFDQPPYLIINVIFAIIFMAIFLYSTIFTAGADNHPIDCYFAQHGLQCPTCGISRGFSEIMRGRVKEALIYNQYSLRLFLFFLLQLLLRIIVIINIKRFNNKQFQAIDILLSLASFIAAFYPIIQILVQNTTKII